MTRISGIIYVLMFALMSCMNASPDASSSNGGGQINSPSTTGNCQAAQSTAQDARNNTFNALDDSFELVTQIYSLAYLAYQISDAIFEEKNSEAIASHQNQFIFKRLQEQAEKALYVSARAMKVADATGPLLNALGDCLMKASQASTEPGANSLIQCIDSCTVHFGTLSSEINALKQELEQSGSGTLQTFIILDLMDVRHKTDYLKTIKNY